MTYKSVAPDLKSSCYNCRFFQLSSDMMNGFCHQSSPQGKSAIGIGTCGRFTEKVGKQFGWSNICPTSTKTENPLTVSTT